MTDNNFEDEFHKRERAVWPDEPSPFEDPFRYETEDAVDLSTMAEERSPATQPAEDSVESADSTPLKSVSDIPWEAETGERGNEVWLNGPPPDEFPFLKTAATPSREPERWPDKLRPFEPPFVPVVYAAESTHETVRRSGLAWSAGIVFFGAVAFMLFLGWLADLVLGSSPWGIVVGVVLGSVIGFIQFFRISSQIYAPKNHDHRPFLTRDDDRE